MTLDSFRQSVAADPDSPEELPDLRRAPWCARKGRWREAHELVQGVPSALAAWIHAHCRLVEGDLAYASSWCRRPRRLGLADRSSREEERESIAAQAGAAES